MSIAEKIRNVSEHDTSCETDYISRVLTGNPVKCASDRCSDCRAKWFVKLADAIEAELKASKPAQLPEGIEWPQYEDGGFVMVGDEISHIGGSKFVNAVAFKRDGAFIIDERWKEFRFLPPFERYKPDTQEAIDADCMMDAKDYCEKHGIKTEWPKHHGKAKCEHLLTRQRALMEARR